ncbi:MAG: DoxX family protein [Verrucomicrobia bacterium]|nr:DoxX family protein [Verrucomicrobiota bacterium]
MNTFVDLSGRGYDLLVRCTNLLRSPLLLAFRLYFFWQLFLTGQGKLTNLPKVSEYFASLGLPFPMFNAFLAGAVETFGSVLLIAGLASRLAALAVTINMIVAYLAADFEAVTHIFSDPDKFVQAAPFPFLLAALIVLAFGPGRFSIDAWIGWRRTGKAAPGRIGAPGRVRDATSSFDRS